MTNLAAVLVLLVPVLPSWAAKKSQPITLDSSVTIVESADEPGPVRRATEDLLSDFTKVFGQRPALANQLEDSGSIAILIAEHAKIHPGINCATPNGPESFAFSVLRVPGSQPLKRVVCLTGADMRGTIYAIYQFSQSYLGVDPMYLWTDKEPERRTSIELPADFTHVYPGPVFR